MAIEFLHRGKKWKADTAEEAIRLRQALEIEDQRERSASDPAAESDWLERLESPWTPAVLWSFLEGIGPQQKEAVLAMAEHEGISSAELTKRLRLSNEMALAGVISGLSKQLNNLNLKPSDLYTVNTSWNGKKKERFFFLHRFFRQTAEEVGWPDEKGEHDATSAKRKRK